MKNDFEQFAEKALERGLTAKECSEFHWQVRSGNFILNYYPTKGTLYISGTQRANIKTNIAGAFDMLDEVSNLNVSFKNNHLKLKTKRRGSYKAIKTELFKLQKNCHYCQCDLTLATATLDHIIPLGKGGKDSSDNWTLACEKCNKDKADKAGFFITQIAKVAFRK